MTILGVAAGREHVAVWADTLFTSSTKPAWHGAKIATNHLAGILAVSAGSVALLREGDRVLAEHDQLDAAVPAIASALRTAAVRMVGRPGDRPPGWFGAHVYVAAGWSAIEGRMVAYTLAAVDLFEPRLATLAVCPEVPIEFCGSPLSPPAIHDIAARQAAAHRALGGKVGRLTIATLTAGGIVLLAPSDIPEPAKPERIASRRRTRKEIPLC